MNLRSTATQWGGISKTLHWATALLIFTSTAAAWYILRLDYTPGPAFEANVPVFRALMPWHKALGIFVIFAVVPRLVWRLFDRRPPLPATMTRWQSRSAAAVHHL